jgi:hypothetical protein
MERGHEHASGGMKMTRGSWGGQLRTVCKIRHGVDELSQVEGDSIVFFAKGNEWVAGGIWSIGERRWRGDGKW